MSTQFDTSILDLNRTDELPALDVVAYEASLAANDRTLSRTSVDEPDDESGDAVPSSAVAKASVEAEALTLNVARILRRIAELEAEIVATHETNVRLKKQREELLAKQAQEELRIESLQADNAQLCKDRTQSDEIAQRLERQLCERAEAIATLEQSLSNKKDVAAQLSRQLAAKLMDCEQAVSTIELRDRTIEDLIHNGADLNQRLQLEIAAGADLAARIVAAEQSLHENRVQLLEHAAVIEKRDTQLVQTQAQIQNLTGERDAFRSAAALLDARAADLEQKNAELAQLRDEIVAAWAEVQSQKNLVKEGMDELGTVRRKLNEHETAIRGFQHAIRVGGEQVQGLMTQLQAALDERATMSVQLDNARLRAKHLTDQIFGRDNRIATLEADLAVHTEALATIQRDVSRIGHRADAEFDQVEHMLEPVGHDGPTLYLTGEVLTVGRTSDNDISIPSKLISRCHARLLVGPTGVIIEDVNSMNGCYVNGEHVRQHLLQDGDVLGLGDVRYRLRTCAVRDRANHDTNLRQLSFKSRRTGARKTN